MAYLFEDLLKKSIGIYDNVFLEVIIDRQRAIIQGRVSVNQYFKMWWILYIIRIYSTIMYTL